MFSSAEKTNHHASAVQQKAAGATFFRKAGDESFFGSKDVQERPAFFGAPIQAKLSVSSPDDPQEKEADAVADQVMRMPDAAPMTAPVKNEDEKMHRKEDEEEVQAKSQLPVINTIQCKDENDEKLQAKSFYSIQRTHDIDAHSEVTSNADADTGYHLNRKNISLHHSDIIQRSGRGPPTSAIPFEQTLSSSKGGGSGLPGDTRQFMESRFNADFSGVRIHTGSTAESLSSNIHAQAFTHGNDIYFNSGKFTPNSTDGNTLLAHELTHTIQQGASKSSNSAGQVSTKISRKNIIQRATAAAVPQLSDAVAKAKTKEGKVNANKEGADGFREGWPDLLDFFKTTFGEDKIVGNGAGAGIKNAVSETDIKKKREVTGLVPDLSRPGTAIPGERDAMPSWCGIFVFWALNKSGVPMPKWTIGGNMIDLKAAYPPGYSPRPGDIAYKSGYSHYAIVESVNGDTVRSVNGNTAGENNMGGQIQSREHPMSNWTGFFNPLLIMKGSLGNGEGPEQEKPKTLAELRKEKFHVDKKHQTEGPTKDSGEETPPHEEDHLQAKNEFSGRNAENLQGANSPGSSVNTNGIPSKEEESDQSPQTDHNVDPIQTKTALSSWSVDAGGKLNSNNPSPPPGSEREIQTKEEEKNEEREKVQPFREKSLQRMQMSTAHCEGVCDAKGSMSGPNDNTVQSKTEIDNSSLKPETGTQSSAFDNEQDRGPPEVQLKATGNLVQCSWLGDAWDAVSGLAGEIGSVIEAGINAAKDWLMDKLVAFVEVIPGYKLARYILGHDPVSGRPADKTPINLLTAVIELVPVAGTFISSVLDYFNAKQPVADWLFGAVGKFVALIQGIGSQFEAVWNGITIDSIKDPERIINQVAELFRNTVTSIFNFAVECGSTFLTMVKDIALTNVVEFVQNYFPDAFDMLCIVLEENPITKQKVARNGTNIMNAGLKMLGEEGAQIKEQMMANGIFQKCVAWIDRAIMVVTTSVAEVKEAFSTLWDTITFESLFHPIDTFNLVVEKFRTPITRVFDFVKDAVIELLKILRDALLAKLSAYAKETKGYYLLTVLIQRDPFTGEHVDFNVENLIHGFMMLMDGGEEQFQQMKESGAIARASQKITAAVKTLNFTWAYVKSLFTTLWESLGWKDFLNIFGVFAKIVKTFGQPVLRLIAFIIEIIRIVIEVLLIIMNFPFDLINNIIAKAMLAFDMIKKDPIGFLKNLLRAIKEGFTQFFGNILTHLWNGLKAWFLGEVKAAGIPIPTDFSVMGIIKWLLAVLDITMEKIWKKLEERIGKEKVARIRNLIDKAEKIANAAGEAYEFMQDVQKRGFMAVMIDKIKEKLSNVWDMVLEAVKSFVMDQIIKKITVKLLSMLDPTGIMAVINSAIALYKAIQSFIKYLRQMLEIVNSFVEGLVEIASGTTKRAADFLEGALGKGVPIAIGFFANQVGLNLSERLKDALELVREKVDKGLDWVIDKLVTIVEKLVTMGKAAVGKVLGWLGLKKEFTTQGESHKIFIKGSETAAQIMIASEEMSFSTLVINKQKEISEIKTASVKSKKQSALDSAKIIYEDIVKVKDDLQKETDEDKKKKLQDSLNTKFDEIVPHLVIIGVGAGGKLPATKVQIGSPGGKASYAEADPLTYIDSKKPERVTVEPGGWASHIKTIAKYSDTYVRLHLLHFDLGGPGSETGNVTPGRKTENGSMYTQAESNAIGIVHTDKKMLWYRAEVTGYRSEPGFTDFAEGINVKYGFKEQNEAGEWVKVGDVIYNNVFPVSKPEPKGSSDPIPTINNVAFNYWDTELKDIAGAPGRTAFREWATARSGRGGYGTWAEFIGSAEFVIANAKQGGTLENWFKAAIAANKLRGI